jgi:hypothetical protein
MCEKFADASLILYLYYLLRHWGRSQFIW